MLTQLSRTVTVCLLAVCFFGWKEASAQVTTADIVGTVTDSSGAVVPNANITIESLATHETRTAQSGGSGDYVFNLLQPGQYSITVEASGFKTFRISSLTLVAGDRARADAQMQIGQTSQTTEVRAQTPALQTDSSTVSNVVTEHAVQNLPLNGRNYITLVQDTPGVNAGNPNGIGSGTRPDDRRQTNDVSASGQPEAYNNNLIDGMDNNEREQGLIMIRPSIDAIAEVKVDTNTYTAEVGRSGGAVINVITKSGGNAFHGSLYEFLRNDKLDANDFFSNAAGLPKPEYRQNQFGGSIGGPIKRNKTFFFGDIEEYRIVQGSPTGLLTVPTLFEEQNPGNFSDIGGPIIPTSKIDPVALKYFGLFAAPNVPGAGTTNNYSGNPGRTQYSTTADVRIDHHFSDNDTFFGRYSNNPVSTFTPGAMPPVDGVQPGGVNFPGQNKTTSQAVQLNYVHIFTPHLLMELKAGFSRLNIRSLQINYGTDASQKFGMPNSNVDQFNSGLAPVTIGGYQPLGDSTYLPIIDVNNVFQENGAVTYTRGTHNIKVGAGLIRRQLNYYQAPAGEGQFAFNGSPPQTMANFLLGVPTTISRQLPLYDNYMRQWEPSFYVQDDWRATRWLTLNIGLRWDYFSPVTNPRYQRANFDLQTLKLVVASPSDPAVGIQPDYKDFAPRFGFAASLGHGMVLRGGFGLSFYPLDGAGSAVNLPNPPFYFIANCQPGTTNGALACPAGVGTLSQGPQVPILGSTTALSGGLNLLPFNLRSSYLEEFNLVLQKQFGQNVITAAYVGELGRRQAWGPDKDEPLPSSGAPNPFVYQAFLPNVNSIAAVFGEGEASYQAGQLIFERRYSKGLVLNASYTFASNLNDFSDPSGGIAPVAQVANNRKYDWGNSDIAIRQRFALTANYELPFAKSATGPKRWLLGGWQINTISFWQTGAPFTVLDTAFGVAPINLPGQSTDRPNTVPGQSLTVPNPNIGEWFNINAFTVQPFGRPGNEGRNQLWGPHEREVDLSLFKEFPLRESWRLQFRAECFNISNTENFANPNANISAFNGTTPTQAGSFGQVTSTLLGANPRQFQFALKLLF